VVKVTAAVILASTLFSIVRKASSTAYVETAIENKEWIVPVVAAPFDLQELSRLELFKPRVRLWILWILWVLFWPWLVFFKVK
jgi:hypothetical protein